MKLIYSWIPDRIDRRLHAVAWAYVIGQIILVGTGGLVRLTDSGLGCPTWPKCTAQSLVNTPAMGIHGFIEFGNRILGVLLGLLAILAFLMILKLRRSRKDLFWLTLLAGLMIPVQAVIGGISVLTKLNPYVVGLHFIVSAALVALCTAFLIRVYVTPGPRILAVPRWFSWVAYCTGLFVAITIVMGILTTGSGPHAGATNASRNNLNPEIMQHVHAIPAYVTFALTLTLVIGSIRLPKIPVRRFVVALLIIELVQIVVGLIQANTGLPGVLVGIHMMLAATLASAMTAVIMFLTETIRPEHDSEAFTISATTSSTLPR